MQRVEPPAVLAERVAERLRDPRALPRLAYRQVEAARMIGVSPGLLRKLSREGRGPTVVRLGRARLYRLADLQKWLDERAGG
jgi:hypothetical protein